jgi:GGDEF domain-containing protein
MSHASISAFAFALSFVWLATVLLRRSAAPAHVDGGTGLLNATGCATHGDAKLAACRGAGKPLSVAVFDCSDLLEVREIYGNEIARKLARRIARKLSAVAGARGVAARTGPAEFTLVLPTANQEKARAMIRRALGHPMRFELDAGDSEIVLVPDVLVESAGADTESIRELQVDVRREMAQARVLEQRRQRYLQRARPPHSRPMGLHANPA